MIAGTIDQRRPAAHQRTSRALQIPKMIRKVLGLNSTSTSTSASRATVHIIAHIEKRRVLVPLLNHRARQGPQDLRLRLGLHHQQRRRASIPQGALRPLVGIASMMHGTTRAVFPSAHGGMITPIAKVTRSTLFSRRLKPCFPLGWVRSVNHNPKMACLNR